MEQRWNEKPGRWVNETVPGWRNWWRDFFSEDYGVEQRISE